jgi:hypothetical protein
MGAGPSSEHASKAGICEAAGEPQVLRLAALAQDDNAKGVGRISDGK